MSAVFSEPDDSPSITDNQDLSVVSREGLPKSDKKKRKKSKKEKEKKKRSKETADQPADFAFGVASIPTSSMENARSNPAYSDEEEGDVKVRPASSHRHNARYNHQASESESETPAKSYSNPCDRDEEEGWEAAQPQEDQNAAVKRDHPNTIDTTPGASPHGKMEHNEDTDLSRSGQNIDSNAVSRTEADEDLLEMSDEMAQALAIDEKNDAAMALPYRPSDIEDERTLQFEWRGENERQQTDDFQEPTIERTGPFINVVQPTNTKSVLSAAPWEFGAPLSVCYVTWNMAQNPPPGAKKSRKGTPQGSQPVSPQKQSSPQKSPTTRNEDSPTVDLSGPGSLSTMLQPCAHIICICTQENGPYVGTDKTQAEWVSQVKQTLSAGVREQVEMLKTKNMRRSVSGRLSLEGQNLIGNEHLYDHLEYTELASINMMATHMILLCRKDVATQASLIHTALEKTGIMAGTVGNKGGLGIALILGTPPAEYAKRSGKAPTEATDNSGAEGNSKSGFMSLLFVGAHLTAHQENVSKRNDDYKQIIRNLKLGRTGPYPLMARPSMTDSTRRDVTEEFDLVFFGGDLNYRIKGLKGPIERMVEEYQSLRLVLASNDQLTIERREGRIFNHFLEGPLLFRPTYKYHIDKSTKLATNEYDKSKKGRMAAYCDRVLYKKHVGFSSPCQLCHYSDVRNIRTSDHLPVVALFTIGTPSLAGSAFDRARMKEQDDDEDGGCCDSCTIQ